jgi:thioredoxin-related protein
METKTFQATEVQNYLESSFYFLRLNGEEQKSIKFHNHLFKYKPTGHGVGSHELVEALATVDDSVSFPTVCILNNDYEIIFQYTGYIRKSIFLVLLSESLK